MVLFIALIATACQAQSPPHIDVPYVPTSETAVRAMLKLADVTDKDVVYDLGSGDGRIVITAAQLYGARGVGVEINPLLLRVALENAKKANVEHLVKFVEQDIFKTDLKEASVVTLFLLTSVNLKLRPKLLHELKPGARVVSHTFDMGDWKPVKVVNELDRYLQPKMFLWVIPRT